MLCFYINASCRLIEQQKLCLVRNPSSKQQLLLIAAGQSFWHTFMSRNFDLHFADYLPEQLILRLILDKQLSLQVAVSHKHRFLYRLAEKQSAFAAIFADICNLLLSAYIGFLGLYSSPRYLKCISLRGLVPISSAGLSFCPIPQGLQGLLFRLP